MPLSVGPTSLDLPAWVQAIGSIAALIVVITLWQIDRISRRRERADERKEKLAESIRLVKLVADQITARREEVRRTPHLLKEAETDPTAVEEAKSILREHILGYLERFSALPLGKWPDAAIATAYFDGVDALRVQIQNFIRLADRTVNRDYIWIEELIAQVQEIDSSFRFFERYRADVEVRVNAAAADGIDVRYPTEKLVEQKLLANRA